MKVEPVLVEIIENFYGMKKPIGATCIAPILLAKVLGSQGGFGGLELTLGKTRRDQEWPFSDSIQVASNLGNKLVNKDVDEVHTDELSNVVTVPA